MTYFKEFDISPSISSADAFGRLRMSTPQTIFDSKQLSDNQPLFWDDQQTSGSGTSSTHSANRASTTLGVGASTAGARVRQTFRHFNYQHLPSNLTIGSKIDGTRDVIVLAVQRLTGTTETFFGSLSWNESI